MADESNLTIKLVVRGTGTVTPPTEEPSVAQKEG